jgi:hypothetical protein
MQTLKILYLMSTSENLRLYIYCQTTNELIQDYLATLGPILEFQPNTKPANHSLHNIAQYCTIFLPNHPPDWVDY